MASAIRASRSSSAMGGLNGSPRAGRVHMLLVCVFHAFAPLVKALPLGGVVSALADEELPKSPDDASLWLYLSVAVGLVLAGGVFAGLTIAYAHAIRRHCVTADSLQFNGPGRDLPPGACYLG